MYIHYHLYLSAYPVPGGTQCSGTGQIKSFQKLFIYFLKVRVPQAQSLS